MKGSKHQRTSSAEYREGKQGGLPEMVKTDIVFREAVGSTTEPEPPKIQMFLSHISEREIYLP